MNIDIVVIGKNVGSTLEAGLRSIMDQSWPHGKKRVIYIDSHSTDESMSIAESFENVEAVVLNDVQPTAGKARNLGAKMGSSEWIHFVDGDVILDSHWLQRVAEALEDISIGAVRGRLAEREPNKNCFHLWASLEWDAPSGECEDFGGTVLMRRKAFEQAGGYGDICAGEDPDLARKIVRNQDRLIQLDVPMGDHDVRLNHWGDWYQRAKRTGWAYSAVREACAKVGDDFWKTETIRILTRGSAMPLALVLSFLLPQLAPLLLCLGAFLLFRPMLCVTKFRRRWNLTWEQAFGYALQCSIIVIPEILGYVTFKGSKWKTFMSLMLLIFVVLPQPTIEAKPSFKRWLDKVRGVEPVQVITTAEIIEEKTVSDFVTEKGTDRYAFATEAELKGYELDEEDEVYLVGPGDVLSLHIWNRDRLNLPEVTVGPDGYFDVPRVGRVRAEGRSSEEIANVIKKQLDRLYDFPEVNLGIVQYNNNSAFVLGRVSHPGVVKFKGRGRLLDALALAGGLPVLANSSFLTKCAIIRGGKDLMWIDLRQLLDGHLGLNVRVRNGDVIFIPESGDEMAYVMGEVSRPGVVKLKERLTIMDAVMLSGGPTEHANLKKVYLVRTRATGREVQEIDLNVLVKLGNGSQNYLLKDNDIVYIGAKGIHKFNYMIRQAMPFLQALSLGTGSMQSLGVTGGTIVQ